MAANTKNKVVFCLPLLLIVLKANKSSESKATQGLGLKTGQIRNAQYTLLRNAVRTDPKTHFEVYNFKLLNLQYYRYFSHHKIYIFSGIDIL